MGAKDKRLTAAEAWFDAGKFRGTTDVEFAALVAAEAGHIERVLELKPQLSFRTWVACMADLKSHRGWDATQMFTLHTIMAIEDATLPGVEISVDWAELLLRSASYGWRQKAA